MANSKKERKGKSMTEKYAEKARNNSVNKAKPKDLGSGGAAKAASAIHKRRQMLESI